jgi:hypothetical protein
MLANIDKNLARLGELLGVDRRPTLTLIQGGVCDTAPGQDEDDDG